MNRETYVQEYLTHSSMRENVKQDKNRLHYHLIPPTGWLNDPNGLCQFKGINHIYYQYTPFAAGWGTKVWGHYTTTDWIHFRQEEPFLFPDCEWDRDGVYSGSALVKGDEIHYFYTGNVKLLDKPYDYILEGREQNTIHLVSKDGKKIETKELVMTNEDYPSAMSKHVRDPKVFEKDGIYYMVLGARDRSNVGQVLLYSSKNLNNWSYLTSLTSDAPFGYMWECPDLMEVDGQPILITCPQGVESQEYKYQNVYQCGCFPLEIDEQAGTCSLGEFQELDYGFDFYASQSFLDEKGRRILLAWMGIPDADYDNAPTIAYDWIHALTIPRVLSYRDGILCQTPLEELEDLRGAGEEKSLQDRTLTFHTQDNCYELLITPQAPISSLTLHLGEDITFTYENQIAALELGANGRGRKRRALKLSKLQNLRIYSDTSSLEFFLNDGAATLTTRVYLKDLAHPITVTTSPTQGRAVCYPLTSLTIENTEHYN